MNRRIDNLGRIVIPREMRKTLGINNNDLINIRLEENKIVLEKVNDKELPPIDLLNAMTKEELIGLLLNK